MTLDRSTAIILAIIASGPPTITAAAAFIVAWKTQDKVAVVAEKVEQVHKATNSMKDQLVEATRSSALQEGRVEGIKEQKAVDKAKIQGVTK